VINEPTTIYAKWVAGTVTAYTVTFNADGGTPAPGSQRVLQGEKVAEPFAPAKEGHIFDGWYTGATAWNFGTDTVSADITLTAGWVESYGGTKTLIITGIDSDVQSQGSKDYTVGVFPIGTPDEDIMTDVLTGSQIQYAVAGDDDRATLLPVQSSNLIVYLEDMETGQPWTGAGTFKVAFILFDGDTVYIYTVDDIRIVSPYTPITMSQFIKIIDFPFSK
jgi:uncharacterized repeat protein (TIGR02543 family)